MKACQQQIVQKGNIISSPQFFYWNEEDESKGLITEDSAAVIMI